MKILLVEDDENKSRQIVTFLSTLIEEKQTEVRRSYSSGLKAIRETIPDLVLLDMSLPSFDGEISSSDGGKFRSYGGRDILHQIARRRVATRVVVVTQYDTFSSHTNAKPLETLTEELENEFPGIFLGTVFYSASNEEWKGEIERYVRDAMRV